jgi:hypothetical protein
MVKATYKFRKDYLVITRIKNPYNPSLRSTHVINIPLRDDMHLGNNGYPLKPIWIFVGHSENR